jgi:type IV secretion system protein VirB6
MPADIVQNFFSAIDYNLSSFFLTSSARVAAAVRPVFNVLVTLYVVLWGFSMWRGLIQEPMADGVMRILKIVLIGTFALNAAVYGPRVAEFLYRTPDQLAAVVLPGAAASTTAAALDASIDRGNEIVNRYLTAVGLTTGVARSLILYGQAVLTAVALAILIGYACALVLLAKIFLSVVLAIGPLMIATLMFKPTQGLFVSWTRAALTAVLKYVVVAAIVSLGLSYFDDAAQATITAMGSDTPALIDLVRMLIVGLAVLVVLWQAPAMASALAGGVQVGTMGMVGWAMSTAKNVAASPVLAWKSMREWKDRSMARQYYRQRAGQQGDAKSDAWAKGRLRGTNSIQEKR